jgi:NADH-quinone oxidoreductase subunit M
VADDHHTDHHADIHDVTPIEWLAWTPLLIAIVVLGVYPQILFDISDPAVSQLVERLGESLNP